MNWLKLFSRVYIRIDDMYNEQQPILTSLNLRDLICEVAKANPNGDIECLYDASSQKICERHTKAFIVRKVENFIAGMNETYSEDENMATYASLKQLNRLIHAFSTEKKQISCYGLVYVYIMYTLLEGKSDSANKCAAYLVALHDLVAGYFEDHPNDELAAFFHGCFDPIIQAIKEKNTSLKNTKIPPRPRKHPKVPDN